MNRRFVCSIPWAAVAVVAIVSGGLQAADQNPWPPARVAAALRSLDRMKAGGLISAAQYAKKRALLAARQAGTFKGTALSQTNPAELNFIQNGGFEEINRNSDRNRSRWFWWGGWSWGGDYENMWETDPARVHSGKSSARIQCLGQPGRIGISTPPLPAVPGATEYLFTVWAQGEGENELFLNFESGATGTLRQKIPAGWTLVTLKGIPDPGTQDYSLYIYVTGQGTIWLDDAKLVPAGGKTEEE